MENQISSKSFMVNNGIILGVASILFALVLYATGNHLSPHWSVSIINAIIFIGIIIYGIKQFKEANDNFLSWGQGVKIGVGVAIVGSLIVVIYNYLFMNFIEPDFMNKVLELSYYDTLEKYPEALASMDLNQYVENAKQFTWFTYPAILMFSLFFGLVESLIVGLIIQKK